MSQLFPFIFVLLWSSAFITTLPIVLNSDPFSALAFRFFFVAVCFFIYSTIKNIKIKVNFRNIFNSFSTGILFHGFYLGGVFYSINILPEFWRSISLANPMLYVVNTFREGMLGISDVSISFSLTMISIFIIFFTVSSLYLLNKGIGIRD